MAAALCILATLGSLWVLAALPVAAKPAKNRSVMVPAAKPGAVPTDRTPTNRSNCLAVAHALNEQADYELGFCSKNEGYACAIAPRSDGCLDSR